MRGSVLTIITAISLAGCSKPAEQHTQAPPNPPQPRVAPNAPLAPEPPPAPRPTIDPKSNAAAEELMQGFVRRINAGRFDEAYMLLGPNAPPRSDFDRQFAGYTNLHARMGAAGDQDGAAGSIYVTVPLTISGGLGGKRVERSADAVLRRVNDVPGSTEAQRHWHIERVDWK